MQAITIPANLPIADKLGEITQALCRHQVVIVAGETGSGKSTQLPKICLMLGRGEKGKIGHTQPRRIAARSVAARVAEELQSELGGLVGYKVRFQDEISERTKVKVLTDGMLLAEMQQDRHLMQYDTLIIDEAHERSLNIDFILGYIKRLLPKRPDLKIIITSATIDHVRFAKHFNNAPIIEVAGRTYPVEVRYMPWQAAENESDVEVDQAQAIGSAIHELPSQGDILVFLATERDIHDTADFLRKQQLFNTDIVPLYARLSLSEQQKVFQPSGRRRIVLSTNVAETSLTVPGIRYVIDSGEVRISRYNYRDKVQQLPIEAISQASANQRAGRCGRVAPGICIRLYSQEDFGNRPAYTEPEILRTNLAAVILQMAVLKLGDILEFPFIEPPDSRFVKDGYRLLHELGALDHNYELKPVGLQLAKFPVDPRLGRMLLAAHDKNCLREVLIVVSGLSNPDPRERPLDKQQYADEAHKRYVHEQSDFLSLVNLWDTYHAEIEGLSQNRLRQYCRQHFLSFMRMREWREIYRQLYTVCESLKWRLNQKDADYASLHQALLTGSLSQIGMKLEDKHEYQGARNLKFHIFPGSAQFKKQPKWLLASELVQTNRLYARIVARIEPEWIEPIALHLLKRSYSEPHWEARRAQVVAYEKVSLYGLDIVARRKVHYGPIDPQLSRELFIRHALVEGDYQSRVGFLKFNRDLLSQVEELEHKARKKDVVVEPLVLEQFYQERLLQDIHSGPQFEQWARDLTAEQIKALHFDEQLLLKREAIEVTENQYPETLQIGSLRLPLSYRFEPGHAEDGVTLTVPLPVVKQIPPAVTEWLVPGLILEKITALIRALPKEVRRYCVPAPEYAKACADALKNTPHTDSLVEVLAVQLSRMSGKSITPKHWENVQLEPHLSMLFKVIDEHGKALTTNRDLVALQSDMAETVAAAPVFQQDGFSREGITHWDFAELPVKLTVKQHGISVDTYPAIIAAKDSVSLKLLPTREQAEQATHLGLRKLFLLAAENDVRYLKKHVAEVERLMTYFTGLGDKTGYLDDFVAALFDQVFLPEGERIRNQASFNARLQKRNELAPCAIHLAKQLLPIAELAQSVLKQLQQKNVPMAYVSSMQCMQSQFKQLIYPGFMQATPAQWLLRLPIYLKAMLRRLEKLKLDPQKERAAAVVIAPLWQQCLTKLQTDPSAPKLLEYRWLLEELRISLFAQELKTLVPVSEKRLNELWRSI